MAKSIKRFHATRRRQSSDRIADEGIEQERLVVTAMIPVKHIYARENRKGLVRKYTQMFKEGVVFDPIELVPTKDRKEFFECVDGNHRTLAAKAAGVDELIVIMSEHHYKNYLHLVEIN